jgi:hypothetical protein
MQFPERIPDYNFIFIQLIFLAFFSFFFINSMRISIKGIIFAIFIYQIILSFSMHEYFKYIVNIPIGYDAIDSVLYMNIAKHLMNISSHDFIDYLQYREMDLSDYGVPFIQGILFKLAGDIDIGINLIWITNAVSMVIGSYFLYRLSMFVLDHNGSKVVSLLWGLNTYSIRSNMGNVKESFLTNLIIVSMYYLYCVFYKRINIINLILLCVLVILTMFFRWYLTVFLALIFCFKPIYSGYMKRIVTYVLILLIILALYTSYFFSSYMNYGFLYSIMRMQLYEQSRNIKPLLILLIAFIGPLPNILKPPEGVNSLLYSIYSFFKLSFSLFALWGIWYILKNRIPRLYPIVFFVFFNILLIIASVTIFDPRFSYTMMPFYYILMIYGFCRFTFKYKNIILVSYYISIVGLIYFYNIR